MEVKKYNRIESAQKIHKVGVDVECIHNNFGGRHLYDFGDTFVYYYFQIWPNFPFGPWTIVRGGQ